MHSVHFLGHVSGTLPATKPCMAADNGLSSPQLLLDCSCPGGETALPKANPLSMQQLASQQACPQDCLAALQAQQHVRQHSGRDQPCLPSGGLLHKWHSRAGQQHKQWGRADLPAKPQLYGATDGGAGAVLA